MKLSRFFAFAPLSLCLATAAADDINLRIGDPSGWISPELIGYNMAVNPPESNVASFLRQSGVGAIRLRLQARRAEDEALPGQGVATQEQFAKAEKDFRRSTHEELRKVWTFPNELNRKKLEEIRRDDIEVMACVTYSPNKFQILGADGKTDWSIAWDLWRRYYAAASELASLGIRRIQVFNEPDHKESAKMSMDDYLARMALATDAVQAALADEPSRGGPKLEPLISAPVTANIAAFGPRTGRPDTRDLERGWGEQTLLHMHRKWDGTDDPGYSQFQQYGYQYYSMDAADYAKKIETLRDGIRRVLKGKMLPIVVSETNVRIAKAYAEMPETQDSPSDFAALGQIGAAMAGGPLDEIYFFRMTQSANLGKGDIKKNGTHYVSNQDPLHNIGGTAKTAEVIRLLAGSFAGHKALRKTEGGKDRGVWSIASDDALWIASSSEEPSRRINADLTAWKPQSGDILVIDEVSTRRHGDVASVLAADTNETLSLDVPGYSVTRVRLLRGAGAARKIAATAAFSVQAGAKPVASETLAVGHRAAPSPATRLVYAGFPGVPAGSMAMVNLSADNPNEAPVILHLYAMSGAAWSPAGKRFPHLADGAQPADQIEPRLIADIGNGVEYAGAIQVPPGKSDVTADLSPVLAKLAGKPFGLLVVREPRFNGDAGAAKDIALTAAPALQVYRAATTK
ncbi:MAG: hypothetical protein RIQ71_2215 [Verrucomicrobiota bacterium]|jgi:hypothetical protein